MPITQAVYDKLANDATLAGLLADYRGSPAVFTTDPAPGDATLPYIVAAGAPVDMSFDTKVTRGRQVWRDVRCYAAADGSAGLIERIAERVRALFHRRAITIHGFVWLWAECSGPIVADEPDADGRIVTVRFTIEEV